MKFIEPAVEYWPQETGIEGMWKQIARATRVCYQSSPRDNETDEEFVKRVILKPALVKGDLNDLEHCKFDFNRMHGGCLEHGTVYLKCPPINRLLVMPFTTFHAIDPETYFFTTNLRALVEHNALDMLKYWCEPTEYHDKRYTFNVITDIGVTREMNRHRTFSICEQSTRYCDFNKDKFGRELTFIRPVWGANIDLDNTYELIESEYRLLRTQGWKPEQARQVLPLGLKTEAVYTAYVDDWKHFLVLRSSQAVSGAPHPNMKLIADKIAEIAKEQNLW